MRAAQNASSARILAWVQNPDHGRTFTRGEPDDILNALWGTRFRTLELSTGWTYDTRNRVIFATRGAMAGNAHIIEVLHFVGAEARFIAAEFRHHFLVTGLRGAVSGGFGAVIVFVVFSWWSARNLATPEADQATTPVLFLVGRGHLTRDFVVSFAEEPKADDDSYVLELVPRRGSDRLDRNSGFTPVPLRTNTLACG